MSRPEWYEVEWRSQPHFGPAKTVTLKCDRECHRPETSSFQWPGFKGGLHRIYALFVRLVERVRKLFTRRKQKETSEEEVEEAQG